MIPKQTISKQETSTLIEVIETIEAVQIKIGYAIFTIERINRKLQRMRGYSLISGRIENIILGMEVGLALCVGTKEAMIVAATGKMRNGPQN